MVKKSNEIAKKVKEINLMKSLGEGKGGKGEVR